MGLSADELAEFVRQSCEAQGVPVRVADSGVVDRVVSLLGAGAPASARRAGRTHGRSEAPDDADAAGVQASGARDSRGDLDVIDDRFDDGGLAAEVEVGPSAA